MPPVARAQQLHALIEGCRILNDTPGGANALYALLQVIEREADLLADELDRAETRRMLEEAGMELPSMDPRRLGTAGGAVSLAGGEAC